MTVTDQPELQPELFPRTPADWFAHMRAVLADIKERNDLKRKGRP
jgi:hypothetical protein